MLIRNKSGDHVKSCQDTKAHDSDTP